MKKVILLLLSIAFVSVYSDVEDVINSCILVKKSSRPSTATIGTQTTTTVGTQTDEQKETPVKEKPKPSSSSTNTQTDKFTEKELELDKISDEATEEIFQKESTTLHSGPCHEQVFANPDFKMLLKNLLKEGLDKSERNNIKDYLKIDDLDKKYPLAMPTETMCKASKKLKKEIDVLSEEEIMEREKAILKEFYEHLIDSFGAQYHDSGILEHKSADVVVNSLFENENMN